jgi:hypothetical protein
VCKNCGKPARIGFSEVAGKKARKCNKCGQFID